MENETKSTVQSLERALILLERLSEHPQGCYIRDLSKMTSLHKSTIHRLLQTLMKYGYVGENDSGRYHLGTKPLLLSSSILESMDIRSVARPFLMELCAITGKTAHILVQDESHAVYIDKVENPNRSISMYSQIGRRIPLYCSASGKAMLAWSGEEIVRQTLAPFPLKRYTTNTICDMDKLFDELEKVRKQGFATDWFEHEENIFCIASPIFGNANKLVAAISIAGLILDIESSFLFIEHCAEVNRIAGQISNRLGCLHYPAVFRAPDESNFRPPKLSPKQPAGQPLAQPH